MPVGNATSQRKLPSGISVQPNASQTKSQIPTPQKEPASGGPIKADASQRKPQKPASDQASGKASGPKGSTAAHKQVPLNTVENLDKQGAGGRAGQKQAADGTSSRMTSSSTSQLPGKPAAGSKPNQIADSKKGKSNHAGDETSLLYITIFIFRGKPDSYSKRHVLAQFISRHNKSFHETVHVQRKIEEDPEIPEEEIEKQPWIPARESGRMDWLLAPRYIGHVNAGTVRVQRGREMEPVDIAASVDVTGKEEDKGWFCLHYLLEGFQKLVDSGYQSQDWYNAVEKELMKEIFYGAVG